MSVALLSWSSSSSLLALGGGFLDGNLRRFLMGEGDSSAVVRVRLATLGGAAAAAVGAKAARAAAAATRVDRRLVVGGSKCAGGVVGRTGARWKEG